ncbi:MAG: hypothetical protein OZSIB_1442 [Candidatus Ozemobacter sibiricus]|uniref:von Willebrand factor type A domain protein n=1 Tax=Candidatus Ozemobacter sibiricus TaxID=2268124 RepID=A0A367ZM99_9BACT|nr:MAG: hypothetical protein OZSIB_1442 [Candidatus Ozemobacter sibiricus]
MTALNRLVLVVCLCAAAALPANAYSLVTQRGPLPLVEQRIQVTINNQLAVTTIEQTFHNPNVSPEEGTYRFPLGEKASVQEFGLTGSDGVRRAGAIEEKSEAENIYQNAQAMGVQPAIAQPTDPNTFETKVGAIPGQSRSKIDLTYTEILPYHMGKIQYSLPFNVKAIQAKTMDVVAITIDLKDQKEIVKVESPTHPITASKVDDHHWRITFERATWLPDTDFQLNYEVKAQRIGFNCLSTQPDPADQGYFMLMVAPQEVVDAKDIVARDIVFVMDVSGSMSGYKIEQTKQAFNFFVDQLNSDDRFGVIAFSDGVTPWQSSLQPASRANRQAAKEFIARLSAGGGTNINDALAVARHMFLGGQSTKAIIFLTDGEPTAGITDPALIAKNMREGNTQKIRTFVFGVGENLNRRLLDQLALENSGETVYVNEGEHLEAKLTTFYETISKPLLVDLSLDFGGLEVSELYPPRLPNVYKGSQVMVTGRYKKGMKTTVTLRGMLNGTPQEYPIETTFATNSAENRIVARTWAKMKADALIGEIKAYGVDFAKKAEVIRLSKAYQFATPYTSFVAVNPQQVAPPVNASLDPYRHPRGQPLPGRPAPVTAMHAPRPPSTNVVMPSGPAPTNVTVTRTTEAKKVSLWGAYSFLPVAPLVIPNFRKAREQSREKACYANMRVIQGAVEMYNMDHSVMLQAIDERHVTALKDMQYLKCEISRPETGCVYYSVGDLAGDGMICCALHGTVEDPPSTPTSAGAPPSVTVVDSTPWETRLWNACVPLIELAINIPLVLIGLWFSWVFFTAPFRWLFAAAAANNQED